MNPLAKMSAAQASGIRFVLMDIDDTLTTNGKLPAPAYTALWNLHDAGLKVIPVTGRPAGWCDLIARQWPVDGVIGENGALAFWEEPGSGGMARPALRQEFNPAALRNDHPALTRIKERAFAETPGIRPAKDQFARMFDIALDFAEEEPVLPLETAEQVRAIARAEGAQAKISSIHVNIWMGIYDKLSMSERFLKKRFGWAGDLCQVMFAGDSPNDEPMFARFPLACGVANVNRYCPYMKTFPAFAASKEGGEGFAEIAETILRKRGAN
ncbi:MAG: HAD-IIB family hydrolase [Treponema sp.]|jgi:HAD superfamily hydrolase (TIGR01484 family)|nr:HAD-IIB family hydrolase [Treponema sp.]